VKPPNPEPKAVVVTLESPQLNIFTFEPLKFESTLTEFHQLESPKEVQEKPLQQFSNIELNQNFLLDFQELKIIQDPRETGDSNSSDSQSPIVIPDKLGHEQPPKDSCEVTRSESPFEIVIQNQNENNSPRTVETESDSAIWHLLDNEFKQKLETLSSMGFLNQKMNYELLLKFQNVDEVLEQLLN